MQQRIGWAFFQLSISMSRFFQSWLSLPPAMKRIWSIFGMMGSIVSYGLKAFDQ
jgi:hypothetical protein